MTLNQAWRLWGRHIPHQRLEKTSSRTNNGPRAYMARAKKGWNDGTACVIHHTDIVQKGHAWLWSSPFSVPFFLYIFFCVYRVVVTPGTDGSQMTSSPPPSNRNESCALIVLLPPPAGSGPNVYNAAANDGCQTSIQLTKETARERERETKDIILYIFYHIFLCESVCSSCCVSKGAAICVCQ